MHHYRAGTVRRSGLIGDPDGPNDPGEFVRLVKQPVTVSLETVRIAGALPAPDPSSNPDAV